MRWSSETRKISELIPAGYNPRKLSDEQKGKLSESLARFSLCDPIIINKNNIVISGHQRVKLLSEGGVDTVDVRVPDRELTLDEEKELNIRMNKSNGEWDEELLKNFDKKMLIDAGFNFGVSNVFEEEEDKKKQKPKKTQVVLEVPSKVWLLQKDEILINLEK